MAAFDLDKYLKELEELVNTDSGSYDIEGCCEVAGKLKALYEQAGFHTNISFQGEEKRPHLVVTTQDPATFEGKERPIDILFIGHMDTVFDKGTAAERPFRIEDGKAFGPGVSDMKAGDLMALYLSRELMERHPDLSIAMVHNSDEEIGSDASSPELIRISGLAKYALDMEPGRISGNFVKERKGCCDFKVNFHGIPGHAGNAYMRCASAVSEMARVITEVEALKNWDEGVTVNCGIAGGGTATNVVPEFAELYFDLRYKTQEQREQFEAGLDRIVSNPKNPKVECVWQKLTDMPPMRYIPETEYMVNLFTEEMTKMGLNYEFESAGGASDGSFVSAAGTPIIDACGPRGANEHTDKEYLVVDDIEIRYNLVLNTLERIIKEKNLG